MKHMNFVQTAEFDCEKLLKNDLLRLIIGKLEIGIYCYITVDSLTKVLKKCSLSSPL